jgi:DNA polymerase I-like protein with 3'-5' exonuclease and polymerase domains
MLSADYCQIELRVMAHFSKDVALREALHEAGDIFSITTARLLNKPVEMVTPAERSHTKAICYGILYGKGERALAKDLGTSRDKAREFKQKFMNRFSRFASIPSFA